VETVRSRGDIVTEKDFDLHFPSTGITEKIFAKEGQLVKEGDPLMKLETTDLELEMQKLRDQLKQAEANLVIRKREAGNIETRMNTVTDKQNTLVRSAYSTLLSNGLIAEPSENNYNITAPVITGHYAGDIAIYRFSVDKKNVTSPDYLLHVFGIETKGPTIVSKTGPTPLGTLGLFVSFSDDLERYVDKTWIVSIPNTKSTSYSNDLNTYQQSLREQSQAIEDARAELLGQGGDASITSAKILQAESEVNGLQSQIALIAEKIRKSTLYAPMDTRITKVWLEKGELAQPELVAITLGTSGFKIQTDISELEIVKIKESEGNNVLIKLDAFPNKTINGKVLSIEPKEVVKDGDKYYRTNILIENNDLPLRSGMSADLSIYVSTKDNILKIPELAVNKSEGKSFVFVQEGQLRTETTIKTGISDGEAIEVTSGLREGQTIAVSAD
jgi:RND family efflux transporter MFP subunit